MRKRKPSSELAVTEGKPYPPQLPCDCAIALCNLLRRRNRMLRYNRRRCLCRVNRLQLLPAMRRTKVSWTENDFQRLRDYAANGYSAYRIAAALKRTVASVRTMSQRLGVTVLSGKAIRDRCNSSS
jgi:hypothetical protein